MDMTSRSSVHTNFTVTMSFRFWNAFFCSRPAPVTVRLPSASSVQAMLLPSASAPQVPLSTMLAAKAAGASDSTRQSASTRLKMRFFIGFLLFTVRYAQSYAMRRSTSTSE